MALPNEDLEVTGEIQRLPGGQQVGVTYTTVTVKHKPTGLIATCGTERSQVRNRNICVAMIEYGLAEAGFRK